MNVQKTFIAITFSALLFGSPAHAQEAATERVNSNEAISGAVQFTPAEIEDVTIVKYDARTLRNSVEVNDHVIVDFSVADDRPREDSVVTIAKTK